MKKPIVLTFALVAGLLVPTTAHAFCGFYVGGADAKLFNNATQVVMMRKGTRTVLSMQNSYQGPPENFAMVVPVPVVLQEEQVKTLPLDIFKRIDSLGAPRLVEYWEQDPCMIAPPVPEPMLRAAVATSAPAQMKEDKEELGVTIEAQFTVGEYEIVILSAKDSSGLEKWLEQEGYKIPKGAEPFLRPYVEAGSKFFVAKVDAKKVTFKDGKAMLSPLRFHYDSEEFSLPVRLGLMNANGKQDLIVHVLGHGKRYEVANYPNVTIPTNIDLTEAAKDRFGEFYAALFDATLEKNPGAVVTEYSWDSSSCDPCPTPALRPDELMTLGVDVIDAPIKAAPKKKKIEDAKPRKVRPATGDPLKDLVAPTQSRRPPPPPMLRPRFIGGWTLTRLHARYDAASMKNDLVFKEADGIQGGREIRSGPDGTLEQGSKSSGINNFQGRYAIRHEWKGKIECTTPVRGRWGGPPAGQQQAKPKAALNLAFVPRGKVKLAQMVTKGVPEIGVASKPAMAPADDSKTAPKDTTDKTTTPVKKEKSGCQVGGTGSGGALGLLLMAALLMRRRRRIG